MENLQHVTSLSLNNPKVIINVVPGNVESSLTLKGFWSSHVIESSYARNAKSHEVLAIFMRFVKYGKM